MSETQKSKIMELLKKKESDFNHQHEVDIHELSKLYKDDSIVFITKNGGCTTIKDKKKAIDVERKLLTPNKLRTVKITLSDCIALTSVCVSCHYKIEYFETMKPEVYKLLKKLSFKDIDMDALIADLNQHGFNVNDMLTELVKNEKNISALRDYFNKFDISSLLVILHRHGVGVQHLLQNHYINDLIKQSPYQHLFLNFQSINRTMVSQSTCAKVSDKRLHKTIHVFPIYKFTSDGVQLVSCLWQ